MTVEIEFNHDDELGDEICNENQEHEVASPDDENCGKELNDGVHDDNNFPSVDKLSSPDSDHVTVSTQADDSVGSSPGFSICSSNHSCLASSSDAEEEDEEEGESCSAKRRVRFALEQAEQEESLHQETEPSAPSDESESQRVVHFDIDANEIHPGTELSEEEWDECWYKGEDFVKMQNDVRRSVQYFARQYQDHCQQQQQQPSPQQHAGGGSPSRRGRRSSSAGSGFFGFLWGGSAQDNCPAAVPCLQDAYKTSCRAKSERAMKSAASLIHKEDLEDLYFAELCNSSTSTNAPMAAADRSTSMRNLMADFQPQQSSPAHEDPQVMGIEHWLLRPVRGDQVGWTHFILDQAHFINRRRRRVLYRQDFSSLCPLPDVSESTIEDEPSESNDGDYEDVSGHSGSWESSESSESGEYCSSKNEYIISDEMQELRQRDAEVFEHVSLTVSRPARLLAHEIAVAQRYALEKAGL